MFNTSNFWCAFLQAGTDKAAGKDKSITDGLAKSHFNTSIFWLVCLYPGTDTAVGEDSKPTRQTDRRPSGKIRPSQAV